MQQLKRSTAPDEAKREARQAEIAQACREYLALAESFLEPAHLTRLKRVVESHLPEVQLAPLDGYSAHGARQIDQIRRRVLAGERIPHVEKVFSIFQPHTEWISNGEAGVAVKLGLRAAISDGKDKRGASSLKLHFG